MHNAGQRTQKASSGTRVEKKEKEEHREKICHRKCCQAALLSPALLTPTGIRALRRNANVFGRNLVATAESLNDDTSNLVRISVTSGAAVLEVTLAILGALAGNANATTTVGNTVAELVDVTGLVTTSKTFFVTLTVDRNVLNVTGFELFHGGFTISGILLVSGPALGQNTGRILGVNPGGTHTT
jgi:hypothetical protein